MNGDTIKDPILRRVVQTSGLPLVVDALTSRLSPTDLQSLLMAVYKRRSASATPATVLRQYKANRFVRLAKVDPTQSLRFDALAFSLLPKGYQAIELSPVGPFGTCSALAPVDQNNVITTIRNTEVVSDCTNLMALECAVRRGGGPGRQADIETRLCCSHRLLRAQKFEGRASFPHFRVLSLCRSGRDTGGYAFEASATIEQVDYYIRLLQAAHSSGWEVKHIRVKLIVLSETVEDITTSQILPELGRLHPNVGFELERTLNETPSYYRTLRFNIHAANTNGDAFFLVDGGVTDWMEKLLNNRKERFMSSGMGTERFLVFFGKRVQSTGPR